MQAFALWVQIITQVVTTVTAVAVAYLTWQTFLKTPVQDSRVDEDNSSELVIFTTSKQITTLRLTNHGLRCYLADKSSGTETLQWTISPTDVQQIIKTRDVHAKDYKHSTGVVDIGAKKNWMYSKRLHPDKKVFEEEILTLLSQQ